MTIARSRVAACPSVWRKSPRELGWGKHRIVMDVLLHLAHEEGRSVIVVTHYPEVADTAVLVLRMKDGVLTIGKKGEE